MSYSIEDSNGHIINNPSKDQIIGVLNRFGKDLEHCNFNYANTFISASGNSSSAIRLFYIDSSGEEINSEETYNAEQVCDIFLKAKNEENSISGLSSNSFSEPTSTNKDQNNKPSNKMDDIGLSKDKIMSSVKNAAKSEIGRSIQRFIRRLIRKIIR